MSDTRRKLKPEKVRSLVESIESIGLLHPITVTKEGSRLVAGLHRLEACRALKWDTVPVVRLTGSEIDAELAEIDENLIRNELTELEQCLAVARRKEIYEARWPETRKGGDKGNQHTGGKKRLNDTMTFSQDTASKTDRSARTTQRQAKIGDALKDMAEEVAATSIADNQKELLLLAKLPEEEQRQVVARATMFNVEHYKL